MAETRTVSRCSVVRTIGVESYDTNVPDGDWHRVSRVITADHHEFNDSVSQCKFCGTTLGKALLDD